MARTFIVREIYAREFVVTADRKEDVEAAAEKFAAENPVDRETLAETGNFTVDQVPASLAASFIKNGNLPIVNVATET